MVLLPVLLPPIWHVQVEKPRVTPAPQVQQPVPLILSPELLDTLRVLLTQTTVSEEQAETPQIAETATGTHPSDEEAEQPDTLFPSVSEDERNKVIEAYKQGIPRREICSYLRWGSSKYSTIVKPVLDAYEQQEQQTGTE